MKIYSRTGDDGSTALFGGRRVSKTDPRVEACGTVDEANAAIGLARSLGLDADVDRVLAEAQLLLFDIGADLATPAGEGVRRVLSLVGEAEAREVEDTIDRFEEDLEPLRQFIVPGGHPASAALQLARATCRRAERAAFGLAAEEEVNAHALRYLNRLSDLLFVLARAVNARQGVSEARYLVPQRTRQEASE